jgi:hypothetical protein
MMGIPFHSETAFDVAIGGTGVLFGTRLGKAVRAKVGSAVGFVCLKWEQAVRTSIKKSRLATMGFFTRPSL